MPMSIKDQAAAVVAAGMQTQVAAQNQAVASLLRSEAERAAFERNLIQHVMDLRARVDELERSLAKLARSAVQQHWDGRLFLPANARLGFEVTINGFLYTAEARSPRTRVPPTVVMDPSPPSNAPLPVRPPLSSASSSSLGSMAQAAASPGDWQSIAASNAIEDPRRAP